MPGYPSCSDTSDVKPFFPEAELYLKPLVLINVSLLLPKAKSCEKRITHKLIIEDLKNWAFPDKFTFIRVIKSSFDFIRYEAEIERSAKAAAVLNRINGRVISLSGFSEPVKVRACLAKLDFPTRQEWDSYFRESKSTNELRPGERPDTIHIQDLPVEWFVTSSVPGKPSTHLVSRVFEQFGAVTAIDIPSNDPYRERINPNPSPIKQFDSPPYKTFEVFIQFRDYIAFVAAMDTLRGMKLLKKIGREAFAVSIKVDFDKSNHLSEKNIKRRRLLTENLKAKDLAKQKVEMTLSEPKSKSSSRPRDKRVMKKIEREEKLLSLAQKKLESIRLLNKLFKKIELNRQHYKDKPMREKNEKRLKQQEKTVVSLLTEANMKDKEDELRNRLLSKFKTSSPKITEPAKLTSEVVKVTGVNKASDSSRFRQRPRNSHSQRRQSGDRGRKRRYSSFFSDYCSPSSISSHETHHLYYRYFKSLVSPKTENKSRHRNK